MGRHYVPKRYLQNFQIPTEPGMIWMYDKRKGGRVRAAIDKVAQIADFYTDEDEDRLAREVESPTYPVIEKLQASQAIDAEERAQLAWFIGTMRMRVPAGRLWKASFAPGVPKEVLAKVRADFEEIASEGSIDPEIMAKRFAELDAVELKYSSELASTVIDHINSPWVGPMFFTAIASMVWRIVAAPVGQQFITTDNPTFYFTGLGMGNPSSELTFPLGTGHCLHGSWVGHQGNLYFVQGNERLVRELNRRLVSEVDRWAFYHEPAEWLSRLLAKERHYLSQIAW